jgi:hypothetical protein
MPTPFKQIHENRSSVNQGAACGQAEDMTKPSVSSRNSCAKDYTKPFVQLTASLTTFGILKLFSPTNAHFIEHIKC